MKTSMVLAVVILLVGAGRMSWAAVDSFDQANDGNTQMRKAGGDPMTANDKNQITGNLNGDGKTLDSEGDHFPKVRTAKAKGLDKSKTFVKHSKSSKTGKGLDKQNGFSKSVKTDKIGSATSGAGSGKASFGDGSGKAGNGFAKDANGFDKTAVGGAGGANQLPAVQK